MEQRGNDHVDWWAVSVRQRREIKRLLTALLAAKTEINWWVKEHGCCAGHENTVVAQIDAVLGEEKDKWQRRR